MADTDYDLNKKRCLKKDCFECSIFWNKKALDRDIMYDETALECIKKRYPDQPEIWGDYLRPRKPAIVKTDKQLIDTL